MFGPCQPLPGPYRLAPFPVISISPTWTASVENCTLLGMLCDPLFRVKWNVSQRDLLGVHSLAFPVCSFTIYEVGDIIVLLLKGCGEGHTSLRV